MQRLLPYPLTSAFLLLLWLMLSQSLAPGQWLIGGVLALVGGWARRLLEPERIRIRRLATVLELTALVFIDIARSNLAVVRVILDARNPKRRAGFVRIPLERRNPPGSLAALACIVTATPGTAWVQFLPEDGMLLLHVLDLDDEAAWIETIKNRYERRLLEIFA